MLLFRDSVASIVKWMHDYNRTDAELAYWLEKYLLFRGTRFLTALIMAGGGGLSQLMIAAASQGLIGWTEFLHGKILVNIESIQHIHHAPPMQNHRLQLDESNVFPPNASIALPVDHS
jgi:hypothetical protein